MSMVVQIWGARGSLPTPHLPEELDRRLEELLSGFFASGFKSASQVKKYLSSLAPHRMGGYGGNTPCVEIRTPTTQVIIDGGSGIRPLGYKLLQGPAGKGQGEVHLVFTHFHWDHIIGLPFFVPLFIPGNQIHVYAVQEDLPRVFEVLFQKPYFPVPLSALGSQIHYHRLEPRQPFQIGDLKLTPYQLDHPDPCWGYRAEHEGRVFSHCVDTEATRVSREELGPDLPLYQGVDLMIFDAQYTLMETLEKIHWGHAAASIGMDIAMREGVKKVVFMHHDPASSDERIAAAENEARRYYQSQLKALKRSSGKVQELDWSFAREGLTLTV